MSKILVVDDNAQNLYLARFLLEQGGHEVDEAYNGVEAVDATEKVSYDLILMDIQMPIMGGIEAARKIKRERPFQLIVALTAKVMSGDREAILDAGCDGVIEKPIEPTHFLARVEAYIL